MVRRSAWAQTGGFDETFYPLRFEDVDFCKRLLDNGYRICYVPRASARQQGGHSASKLLWGDRQLLWYGSLLRYASKHLRVFSRLTVSAAVMLACLPRTLAAMPKFGIRQPVSVYSRVVWLAVQCLRKGERGPIVSATLDQPAKEQFKQSQ